jgi:preprotein translocase subunit Sss1
MTQTTTILYAILAAITVLGGVGFLVAIIAMAKSGYHE